MEKFLAEIHVKDSGKGILLERQAEIFTRFYREPEVHDAEGIGVGLYLTRRIIELQNGYVDVRSEPGEGSDFGCISSFAAGNIIVCGEKSLSQFCENLDLRLVCDFRILQ